MGSTSIWYLLLLWLPIGSRNVGRGLEAIFMAFTLQACLHFCLAAPIDLHHFQSL